jgi:hypothetical protein
LPAARDLVGKQFGELIVLSRAGSHKGRAAWNCLCSCGKELLIVSHALTANGQQSCGCLRNHGESDHQGTRKPTAEYASWRGLKSREICPQEWSKYQAFLKDLGRKPSDRYRLCKHDYRLPHSKENTYWRNLDEPEQCTVEPGFIDLSRGTFCLSSQATTQRTRAIGTFQENASIQNNRSTQPR